MSTVFAWPAPILKIYGSAIGKMDFFLEDRCTCPQTRSWASFLNHNLLNLTNQSLVAQAGLLTARPGWYHCRAAGHAERRRC
jgi:hypothetical protein